MSSDDDSTDRIVDPWVAQIAGPVIAAVVVGLGSGYLGSQTALARVEERLEQVESIAEKARRDAALSARLEERLIALDQRLDRMEEQCHTRE